MREEPGKSSSLRESGYRVAVLVVVIGCHLGLLMLLLRPVIFYRGTTPVVADNPLALKLRFFQAPQLPAHRPIAPAVRSHATPPARSSKPLAVRQTAHVAAMRPHETRSTGAGNPDTSEDDSTSDGGFQEQLRDAQRSHSVHGVPGSDTPFVPGIRLVDPMSQGIGAVIRTTQRALGVKDSHCIDVDVWRHLTPQELSARHISPGDVDKVDEKYDCNRPPGLRF
ncbi:MULTISPECIES: hypothetical protein [unclassified Rhodanobacter]|uniref:hypothetical protein n=1 Tax=unclassified Rhodanobacter TaxID=2621553 RepID=UPI001BDDECE3|nr:MULTISPECIES: hypothetical protein [unclassified Rhodanobacter]MBT2144089.1 hypothetical protein [Rhodanobacter sp. LX-99]MBT2150244.1 hypothetical protein [Rhodanobacter sp. LX-100]